MNIAMLLKNLATKYLRLLLQYNSLEVPKYCCAEF
jgi:hypothetical protein